MPRSQIRKLKTANARLSARAILILAVLPFLGTFSNPKATLSFPDQIRTGPDKGQTIPPFDAIDQDGRMQSFETIRGPRGALIVFFRSADW